MAGLKLTAVTVTIRGWIREIGVTTPPIATECPIVIAAHTIGGTGWLTTRTTGTIITTMGTGTAPATDYCLGRPRQTKLAAGIPSVRGESRRCPPAAFVTDPPRADRLLTATC